ncbi:hypothetical protein AZE42_06426 [Rhizopogon vesiculosus]|uniref:Uncharacterized protein n=1 Tax=Rhizopogon vesiculosus TaxID=180088 RepID=A0A1J8QLZ4_9AGAM|nr:hypothetical protein AZE42_06426 [Rhizopogon vesiculosus]
MSSRPLHEIAYQPVLCEDIDIAVEGGLNSNVTLRNAIDDDFPDRQHVERKLLRKLDLRMSILVLMYTLNFIDRNNVAWVFVSFPVIVIAEVAVPLSV